MIKEQKQEKQRCRDEEDVNAQCLNILLREDTKGKARLEVVPKSDGE
jgi:hypothetical protein